MLTKKQIREQMRVKRSMYPLDQKQHDDSIILRTLLSLDLIENANAVCTFISMQDEINTRKLINHLLKSGKSAVIAPKVDGNTLKLFRIPHLRYLKESKFGVLEPSVGCQPVSLTFPDVFITPGLAFSSDGYRLGYGRGYYDWLFARTISPRIGIAYDFQVLETLPFAEYDRQVDILVTPTRIINCTKRFIL